MKNSERKRRASNVPPAQAAPGVNDQKREQEEEQGGPAQGRHCRSDLSRTSLPPFGRSPSFEGVVAAVQKVVRSPLAPPFYR